MLRSRVSLLQSIGEQVYTALNLKPYSEDGYTVGVEDRKADTDVTVKISVQKKPKILIVKHTYCRQINSDFLREQSWRKQ